jgi:hypothetical protein
MMIKRLGTASVLVLLLGFGGPLSELQAKGTTKLNSLSGTVYTIDLTAHTVTIKSAGSTQTTLNVTRKSKILRNGKKGTLTGLVLGDQVTALFDSSKNAAQLGATGPVVSTVQGGVLGVTSGTGTVQINTGRLTTDAIANAKTRLVRNGKIASLISLTVFDKVTSHTTPGPLAVAASPGTPGIEDAVDIQAEGPEESEVSGTISALDVPPAVLPALHTVTITPDVGPPVTVNITADTLIEVSGAPALFTDLATGMFVDAEYDPVTFNAFHIEAEEEGEEGEVEGFLAGPTAVDTTLNTVTITDSLGNTLVVLTVDASTKIELNDQTVLFSDLATYLATNSNVPVSAEYNVLTLVAKEIQAGTDN